MGTPGPGTAVGECLHVFPAVPGLESLLRASAAFMGFAWRQPDFAWMCDGPFPLPHAQLKSKCVWASTWGSLRAGLCLPLQTGAP